MEAEAKTDLRFDAVAAKDGELQGFFSAGEDH